MALFCTYGNGYCQVKLDAQDVVLKLNQKVVKKNPRCSATATTTNIYNFFYIYFKYQGIFTTTFPIVLPLSMCLIASLTESSPSNSAASSTID